MCYDGSRIQRIARAEDPKDEPKPGKTSGEWVMRWDPDDIR